MGSIYDMEPLYDPTPSEVRSAVLALRRAWNKRGLSPRLVNCGNCDSFAEELLTLFPQGDTMWGEDNPKLFPMEVCPSGHCFFCISHSGVMAYYDSECFNGVPSPHLLPYYKRNKLTHICSSRKKDAKACCNC